MENETLRLLEKVNQLALTEAEKVSVLAFFEKREQDMAVLNAIDTEGVERMVHVLPILTVVREDIEKKLFTRDELQKGAPETMDGYWQVPRVVE
jgi:aspartyl/glutamyl-tRNA(Asn/Gln) amidotransferase C subunit